jgi:hypothetical protein
MGGKLFMRHQSSIDLMMVCHWAHLKPLTPRRYTTNATPAALQIAIRHLTYLTDFTDKIALMYE